MTNLNQENSDGSCHGIEMAPDSWELIREYIRDGFGIFGVFCAALIFFYAALRYLA